MCYSADKGKLGKHYLLVKFYNNTPTGLYGNRGARVTWLIFFYKDLIPSDFAPKKY